MTRTKRSSGGGGPETLASSGFRRWRLPLAITAVVLVTAVVGIALLFAGPSSDDRPDAQTGNPASGAQLATPTPAATTTIVTPSPRATPTPDSVGGTGPAPTAPASPTPPGNGSPQRVPASP